jgi:hypothetical protein
MDSVDAAVDSVDAAMESVDAAVRSLSRALHTAALEDHVAAYESAPKQRSEAWLAAKGDCVGGSELATVLGHNPYQTRTKLVSRKLDLCQWTGGGVACQWGTMFEPVSERILELECGVALLGSDIHVKNPGLIADLGNSPDGYCVVALDTAAPAGELRIQRADQATASTVYVPVLVELKAPYGRIPERANAKVPRHYVSQVMSGQSLCPPAAAGLYIEIVFRLCSLADLGPSPDYCLAYHRGDQRRRAKLALAPHEHLWDTPVGWGATAVYAPKLGSQTGSARTAKVRDAEMYCYRAVCAAAMVALTTNEVETGASPVDLGDLANEKAAAFDHLIVLVDEKVLPIEHSDPHLPGTSADGQAGLNKFLRDAAGRAPPGHYLFGLLAWKAQEAGYHLLARDDDYLDKVGPLVESFMADVRQLRGATPAETLKNFSIFCAKDAPSGEERLKKSGYSPECIAAMLA